jgi:hypothetical protein
MTVDYVRKEEPSAVAPVQVQLDRGSGLLSGHPVEVEPVVYVKPCRRAAPGRET